METTPGSKNGAPKNASSPRYVLRNGKGEYYSFTDQANYDGPQLSRDPGNAKQMTAQGCGAVKRLLANPKYHGQEFERVAVTDMITAGLLPQPV